MIHLPDAAATQQFGDRLARALLEHDDGLVMTLEGELGAGKTALARATIIALGYAGVVVSPTYTLLESYVVGNRHVHHLDLYRLADPEELEFIGLRDLEPMRDWFMIEWPGHGRGYLPAIDLSIGMHHAGVARDIQLESESAGGDRFMRILRTLR